MINWEYCRGIIPGASNGRFHCLFLRFHSPFHRSFLLFVVACRFLRRFALPRPCRIFRFSPIDLNSPPISVQFLYCIFFRLIASYSVPSWQVPCRVHTYAQTNKQTDAPFAFSGIDGSSSLPICSFSYFSSIPW